MSDDDDDEVERYAPIHRSYQRRRPLPNRSSGRIGNKIYHQIMNEINDDQKRDSGEFVQSMLLTNTSPSNNSNMKSSRIQRSDLDGIEEFRVFHTVNNDSMSNRSDRSITSHVDNFYKTFKSKSEGNNIRNQYSLDTLSTSSTSGFKNLESKNYGTEDRIQMLQNFRNQIQAFQTMQQREGKDDSKAPSSVSSDTNSFVTSMELDLNMSSLSEHTSGWEQMSQIEEALSAFKKRNKSNTSNTPSSPRLVNVQPKSFESIDLTRIKNKSKESEKPFPSIYESKQTETKRETHFQTSQVRNDSLTSTSPSHMHIVSPPQTHRTTSIANDSSLFKSDLGVKTEQKQYLRDKKERKETLTELREKLSKIASEIRRNEEKSILDSSSLSSLKSVEQISKKFHQQSEESTIMASNRSGASQSNPKMDKVDESNKKKHSQEMKNNEDMFSTLMDYAAKIDDDRLLGILSKFKSNKIDIRRLKVGTSSDAPHSQENVLNIDTAPRFVGEESSINPESGSKEDGAKKYLIERYTSMQKARDILPVKAGTGQLESNSSSPPKSVRWRSGNDLEDINVFDDQVSVFASFSASNDWSNKSSQVKACGIGPLFQFYKDEALADDVSDDHSDSSQSHSIDSYTEESLLSFDDVDVTDFKSVEIEPDFVVCQSNMTGKWSKFY